MLLLDKLQHEELGLLLVEDLLVSEAHLVGFCVFVASPKTKVVATGVLGGTGAAGLNWKEPALFDTERSAKGLHDTGAYLQVPERVSRRQELVHHQRHQVQVW